MRTLASFNSPTPAIPEATATVATQQRSPWHSPVPYLFGGLVAMLGVIAFALLILACSYWKLSGRTDDDNNGDQNGDRDVESGQKDQDGNSVKAAKVYEEKILVIMAGDEKPTFLATPVCSKASSFADGKETNQNEETDRIEIGEKVKEVSDHQETQRDQEQNQ